jgi:hypothetical protein
MKKFFPLFLALCIMVFIIASSSFADSSNTPESTEPSGQPIISGAEESLNQSIETESSEPNVVENLSPEVMAAIQFSQKTNKQYDKLTEHWGDKLPSYYAGAYIKDLKFNILVTCDPSSIKEEIWQATDNPNINIQQVKYSYDYLTDVKDDLLSKISQLKESGDKAADLFIGFGVDEINNRIFVEVLDNGKIDNKAIYNIIDNDEIVDVVIKDKPYNPNIDINAGFKDWIKNDDTGRKVYNWILCIFS